MGLCGFNSTHGHEWERCVPSHAGPTAGAWRTHVARGGPGGRHRCRTPTRKYQPDTFAGRHWGNVGDAIRHRLFEEKGDLGRTKSTPLLQRGSGETQGAWGPCHQPGAQRGPNPGFLPPPPPPEVCL